MYSCRVLVLRLLSLSSLTTKKVSEKVLSRTRVHTAAQIMPKQGPSIYALSAPFYHYITVLKMGTLLPGSFKEPEATTNSSGYRERDGALESESGPASL